MNRPRSLGTVAALLLAACAAAPSNNGFTTSSGGAATSSGTGGDLVLIDAGGGGGPGGSSPGCATETQFVYTLTATNELYRFDPPNLTFTLVGTLDCPTYATPYSMAVARDGQAWSVFNDGSLFKFDVKNAHCTATGFVPGQHGFGTFGMGFASNTMGGAAETLFVSDSMAGSGSSQGLAKIDTATLTLTPIAAYDQLQARAEMTGNGNGQLFGAFEGTPYVVAEIDKANAHILNQAPQSAIQYAPGSSNFAFAFWGGDFWLFVGPGYQTDVFHYEPAKKATTKVKTVSFEIVGAGVSTCAPVTPPA